MISYLRKISLLFKVVNKKAEGLSDFHIMLTVFALGLLLRFIHWEYFGSNIISFPIGVDNSLYHVALKDHLFEYLYYYHTKPVGTPIFDYLSLIIFGSISKGHFLIISLLDIFR